MQETVEKQNLSVGLFVTCLVDSMRPSVGFAAINLLELAGCQVSVPEMQTCCGQPAFNSGDASGTAKLAKQLIEAFEQFDYVVVPSGSCAGMIKAHFVEVLEDETDWFDRAEKLAEKTYELLSFLTDVCDYRPADVTLKGSFTYHDSCSGLRELGVYEQPRALLAAVDGLAHAPLKNSTECCGFGGTFCVKYPDISNAIVEEKSESIVATQADFLLGGDWGCLMNMGGKLNRLGHKITVMHTAEVLAGMAPEFVDARFVSETSNPKDGESR